MPFRLFALFLAGCAVLATLAVAESTQCAYPVVIVPDGRTTQSTFPQSTTYWYAIYAQAGHSYSVEFVPPADNYLNGVHPQFGLLSVYGPNDLQGCRGSSTVTATPNSAYSPTLQKSGISGNGVGRRVSFTAQSPGLYSIPVTNAGGAGGYSFRAVDTTLFNPRWNTMSGYDIQWIIMNMSDMPITGTLTVVDMNGQVITAAQVSIPAGGRATRNSGTSDLNLPRDIAGCAMLAHNGPPNSLLGEAFMISATATLPEKFETVAGH